MTLDVQSRHPEEIRVIFETTQTVVACAAQQITVLACGMIVVCMKDARGSNTVRLGRPTADHTDTALSFQLGIVVLDRHAVPLELATTTIPLSRFRTTTCGILSVLDVLLIVVKPDLLHNVG